MPWSWSRTAAIFAGILLLILNCFHHASCNCALYGCTTSLSFTCPTDFYAGSFWPELFMSYEDADLKPTGAGCATNDGKILCPLVGSERNTLIVWNILAQFESWNKSMKRLVTVPAIDTYGDVYVTDGDELCGLDDTGKPFGPCIKMEPVNGPLFDLTVVADRFLYLLYKCGFMVAYFTDGVPYASIWLNTTVDGIDGTFVPLTNPAISGERVYIVAAFKSLQAAPTKNIRIRLYAIDVRTIMTERIKIVWFHDFVLENSIIPYTKSSQTECTGKSDLSSGIISNVIVEDSIVVASVNYANCSSLKCSDHEGVAFTNSLLISITDEGDSGKVNFFKLALLPFQAVAYASPNFTALSCDKEASYSAEQAAMWISWIEKDGNSLIEKMDLKRGASISTITISSLKEISLTSKMSIFYNDQDNHKCYNEGNEPNMLTPLVFGYSSKGQNYLAAVDISLSNPELRWSILLPNGGDSPVLDK